MPDSRDPVGLRSRQVCDLLRIPSSTLNYWVQVGVARPSIRGPQGRRVEQYWSVEDVVVVRAVQRLRRQGASLQQVRKARREIEKWGSSMSNARLYWDGREIYLQDEGGDLVSTLKRPSQRAWLLAALPLGEWHRETSTAAGPIELDEQRERSRRRRRQEREREQARRLEGLL